LVFPKEGIPSNAGLASAAKCSQNVQVVSPDLDMRRVKLREKGLSFQAVCLSHRALLLFTWFRV